MLTWTLSVAAMVQLACPTLSLKLALRVMFAGQVTLGGVLSTTVTVYAHDALFRARSQAKHVMVVAPITKTLLDGPPTQMEPVTMTLSIADGTVRGHA